MRAATDHLGIESEIPFACIDKPHNLSDPEQRKAFIQVCNETAAWLKARFGVTTCLLIIDTAMKAFTIEDENDNAEIAAVCKSLEHIGRETECFAFVVVHAGKNMSAGARGASAWLDNVDIALFVSGERDEVKGTCVDRALSQTKNRDGPEGPIAAFDLKLMELGTDADGEPFGAMAVEPDLKRPVACGKPHKWTDTEIIFKDAFNEVAITRKQRIRVGPHWLPAVEVTALREEFCKRYATGEGKETNLDTKTKAFRRALKNTFLLQRYPRETRDGVEWIWSAKDEPDDETPSGQEDSCPGIGRTRTSDTLL